MGRHRFRPTAVLALALLLPVLLARPAEAAARVSRAEVSGTQLRIEGTALANRAITVDGVRMTTSDGSGRFRIDRSGYTRPADCTVEVNDGSATPVTVPLSGCTVVTAPPPPSSTNSISPDVSGFAANVGTSFQETFVFGPEVASPSRFRLESGALPAGLALTEIPITSPRPFPENAIRIEGTPTTVQTSTFTLRATDANGLTATRIYTIEVGAPRPLGISPQTWGPLVEGSPQNLFLDGDGGVMPYSWSISAGALPVGMSVVQDSQTVGLVRIGGTPTTAGAYTFTLRLTDARQATVDREFSVVVSEPVVPALAELAVTPSVIGGNTVMATVRLVSPAPPGGSAVGLSSSRAVASVPESVTVPSGDTFAAFPVATTAVAESTTATLTASYAGGTRTAALTVTPPVTTPPLVFSSETGSFDLGGEVGQRLIPLEVGTSSNRFFTGGGGVLPYRWAVTAGALPPGMALVQDDPDGVLARIGGTPTAVGRYAFTLRLTDARGTAVSHAVTATIGDGTVAGTTLASLTLDRANVSGGTTMLGTVTLDVNSPAHATVKLSSSSPAALVSDSVTVPAGSRTAQFPITTTAVASSTPATITAVYGAVTLRATVTVDPPANPPPAPSVDTVSVSRAEYDSDKRQLRVDASSSASGVMLRVYATATNNLIGTLSGGRGEFSVSVNPQNITVRSSAGGSAARRVTIR